MRTKQLFSVLLLIFFSNETFACSFLRNEPFKPPMPSKLGTGIKPEKPKVDFELVRGNLGPGTLCDDTGIVILKIEAANSSKLGYQIEILENSMAYPLFPDYVFYSNNFENGKNVFYFPWVDGATEVQEPVKIVFKLYSLSPTWAESEPVLVTIEDEGRFWH